METSGSATCNFSIICNSNKGKRVNYLRNKQVNVKKEIKKIQTFQILLLTYLFVIYIYIYIYIYITYIQIYNMYIYIYTYIYNICIYTSLFKRGDTKYCCDSPETFRELCFSTKLPHQKIRWNNGILRSVLYFMR